MIADKYQERIIDIHHRQIPVWVFGDEEKEKIVFIHGLGKGFSDYVGDLPTRYLMKEYCVVAFDLPGYGRSKEISISNNEFLESILIALQIERCFLFGVSYGGAVSLLFSLRYKDVVKGVIVAGLPWASIPVLISFLFAIKMIPPLFYRTLRESLLLRRNISQISAPVLLLYSSGDRLASVGMGEKYNLSIPNSRLCTITKRSHGWLMHKINENKFLPQIQKFLQDYS